MELRGIRVRKGVVAIVIITCCLRGFVFVQSWVRHSPSTTSDAVFLAFLVVMSLGLILFRTKGNKGN